VIEDGPQRVLHLVIGRRDGEIIRNRRWSLGLSNLILQVDVRGADGVDAGGGCSEIK